MNIKVLGGGCCKCENLLGAVKEAVAEKGIEAEIEYITDMAKIMERVGIIAQSNLFQILGNDYMPVVPVITATAETTLRWAIDGEAFHKTVSAGSWEIPELELRHGDNSVSVTGEGTTTFTYRQGRL